MAAEESDLLHLFCRELPVVETFHSLQGEGIHVGRSAFFIRLAGCTVGCLWCDTKQSWHQASHAALSLRELASEARSAARAGAAFVVITGGEPLHHNLDGLCACLLEAVGLPLHLETSGVDPVSGQFNWITLSPKRHQPPRQELLAACHELKVVVHEQADLAYAEVMASAAHAAGNKPALLLQPCWKSQTGKTLSVNHVKSNSIWRLSFQNHKHLGVR